MGYRELWFANNRPNRFGKYQCVQCRGWFDKSNIDIDHRIPKRDGGTDDLWNLQPMCRTCNRSKRDRQSNVENAETLIRATMSGELDKALGGIAIQKAKDFLGLRYKR